MAPAARPPVIVVCGLAFEAAIAAGPGVVAVHGLGPVQAGARLAALLGSSGIDPRNFDPARTGPCDRDVSRPERRRPGSSRTQARPQGPVLAGDRLRGSVPPAAHACLAWAGILSFGCAGGLDPALAPGSCVVADAVLAAGERIATDLAWTRALLACLPGARSGPIAGLDAPLASTGDKARLWQASGACAVDMESQAVAVAARRHGLPFAACRVVLDPAWRSLPAWALAGLRADGRSAPGPLLRALCADPRELASLGALAREAWLARRALRRVRDRLGDAFAFPGSQAWPRPAGDPV